MNSDYIDDPEFQVLIKKYLAYLQEELAKVQVFISQSDYPELRQFGHNLKGTGGGYGFDHFTVLGEKINRAAHKKDMPSIQSLVSTFTTELNEAKEKFSKDPAGRDS